MKKGSVVLIAGLLISVALIIGLAVMSAKQDVDEVKKIQETEVIQEQKATEMKDAMDSVTDSIESGYEDLDSQIGL
ncbi:MAG: hypothetical protein IKI75_03885 [Lachnospiraceae bacterium]|nr:hypothetical protein [Lachnospiraceae bacterium]